MTIKPITFRAACAFIKALHRHNPPPQGCKFAISCWVDGKLIGVSTAGRPVSKELDDGITAEITRVCTDGTRNACSFLYARTRRVCQAMGYVRIETYNLKKESGDSLRAAGFTEAADVKQESWHRQRRPRDSKHEPAPRTRWSAVA